MNSKIKKAIKSGKLVSFKKLMAKLPASRRRQIYQKARYLQVAMAVRSLRKRLNLSQAELAKKLNSKREYISRVESGSQNVTLETLYQIAEATNKKFSFEFK
ncbi:helix-turn-helix domain-containing protein [Patescibacteria group bacterium]